MLRTPSRLVRRCVTARSFSSSSRDWFGIDSEYLSVRGLRIVSRVLNGIPEFTRYSHSRNPRVFVSGTSDNVRNSMFVLSQFPTNTQVDLRGFVQDAERAAHTVLQRLYTIKQETEETKEFLQQLATPESLKALMNKPSAPVEGESKEGRVVLEQLSVNSAALDAVEYTRERVDEQLKSEWLALRVQYDVTEHLLVTPEVGGLGIQDRRVVNTRFAWTFEADVTKEEELDWAIVAATPFEEKPAVLTTTAAQQQEKA